MATVSRRFQAFVMLWMLLLACAVHADFKKSYGLGLKAHAGADWAQSARHMREALDERSEPQARARLAGMEIKPYVPQLYLAFALAKTNRCAETAGLLAQSGVAVVIAQLPDLAQIQTQVRALCSAAAVVSEPKPAPPVVAQVRPTVQPAPVPAKVQTPPKSTTPVKGKAVVSKPPAPQPAPVKVASQTPSTLLLMADWFVKGDYARVVATPVEPLTDSRAQAFALGLRAAAKLMQADADPAQAAQLRAAAKADLARARAIDPRFKLNPAAFSPRIRGLLG